MKKVIIIAVVAVIIIADLAVMLYPTVSAYVNSNNQSRAVARYVDDVSKMDAATKQRILEAAHEYNKALLQKSDRFRFTKAETAEYDRQLNTGSGIMGTLVIDKINVKLPIYHGTGAGVLQVGLGHLPGSSLPVGGVGTHSIISGHRGLPSATLLTNLDKMSKGDTFMIYVLGDILTYQVDQIKVVNPDEVQALGIDPARDYCTLVTCTPYGINTQRLLVRGHRVPNAPNTNWDAILSDASQLDKARMILMFISPILLALTLYIVIKCWKIHKEEIVL